MNVNVGATDRRVRTAVGALAGAASLGTLAGLIPASSVAALVLGIVAIAMLGTAVTGVCGLYAVLGVDTCSIDS
ncbi:hypothetical protein JCM18237_06000 [Halorubrum luteum]